MASQVDREPPEVICPITQQVFVDPVRIASGKVYERTAILRHWHIKGRPHDPLGNFDLESSSISVAADVRQMVAAFIDSQPAGYVPEGWESREAPPPREDLGWNPGTPELDAALCEPEAGEVQPRTAVQLLRAHSLVLAMGVLGFVWCAVVVFVVIPPYQNTDRQTEADLDRIGRHAHHAVAWAWRFLVLLWAAAHIYLPWRIVKAVRQGFQEKPLDRLGLVEARGRTGVALLIFESILWAGALYMIAAGHFKGTDEQTGYELSMNLGGPTMCLHGPEDVGYASKDACDDAFRSWMLALYVPLLSLVALELAACTCASSSVRRAKDEVRIGLPAARAELQAEVVGAAELDSTSPEGNDNNPVSELEV